ncbi:hypothetical protein ACF1DY_01900 [Streptomyces albus]
MTDEQKRPITPTRIIPSSASTPPPAPPLPPAPAGTDPASLPPWRRPAPAPAPPAPPTPPPENWHTLPAEQPHGGPIEIYVTLLPVPVEDEPEPGMWARAWAWLTARVRPASLALALAGALVPIPWTGYSIATTWAAVVHEARGMHPATGYTLGVGTLALAAAGFRKRPRSLRALFLLVVTTVGVFGAFDWYDPITWLTGVHR